ncbi:MAG TPA: hypothetical protein VF438_02150 [Candidatus Paceibacterota bacterium]
MPTTQNDLATSSIPYPYLPEGRTFQYVPLSNPYMSEAKKIKEAHTSGSAAVVVRDGVILGKGSNRSPLYFPKLISLHNKYVCLRRWLRVPTGTQYWVCPGCSGYNQHSEARAVRDAIRRSGSIAGADMYFYGHWWCCQPCWDKMIAAGIRNVYLVEGATQLFKR